jgi:nucleoside-diphosphate-sugar epimerase
MRNKKKILICGATGFIGSNLARNLAKNKNNQIFAVFNKKKNFKLKGLKWKKINLTNKKQVNNAIQGMDVVIQAAATTSGSKDIINSPEIHVTDNAVMNSYILRACKRFGVKHFIFFSCTVMYPSSKKSLNESIEIDYKKINSKYFGVASTKLYIEKLCEFYSKICETKFTCIRHSNVYGEFDKFDLNKGHFFAANMLKILNSNNKSINVWGDGQEKRDLLYIGDLILFVKKILKNQKEKFKIYNCSYGKSFKVNEIIKKIIMCSNKKIEVQYDASKPSIKTNILIDSSLAKKEMDWLPKTNINQGVIKTYRWLKKNYEFL